MASGDTTRPARDVARWITNTRKESHRVLGDVELGVKRAVDHLSASIAARSGPDDLAPIADIQLDTVQFLATVKPILEDLADRMARALAHQLRPLDVLAEQRGGVVEANVRAARATWARSIRSTQAQVAQYVAGYVEGGGLALALLTELSPEHAGHTGHVAEILSARLAFVPKRAEAGVGAWLSEVQRGLDELLAGLGETANLSVPEPVAAPAASPEPPARSRRTPTAAAAPIAAPPPPARAPTPPAAVRVPVAPPTPRAAPAPDFRADLALLVEKAKSLGVRVRNVPDVPTGQYVERLAAQLAQVEAKRDAEKPPGETPRVGLDLLLQVADTLGVKLKEVPERPSDLYLEKLQAKLVDVARRRGVAVPLALGGQPPAPPPPVPVPVPVPVRAPATTLDNSATTDIPPDADSEREARIVSLVERATEAGLDLGRVPVDPTHDWIVATEGQLKAAIDRRNAERKAERDRRDAERQVQLDRLTSLAERLGVELRPPKFPTDEWLARAELRISSLLLTPAGGSATGEFARDARFNRVLIHAAEANVELGEIPPEPDPNWLDWAEEMVADATGAHTIVFESDTEEPRQAWLVFEEGTVQEHHWPITPDAELSIGRGRGNTVQIRNDAGVSRRHCTVRMEGGAVVIRDEGSTKGVVVDGQQLTEAMLVGGEQIVLGETLFVFRVR